MSERFVTTPSDGSRDTLYERRNALSRDLLGDTQDGQQARRTALRRNSSAQPKAKAERDRKPRVPEMALGLVLVLGGALAASTLASKRTDTIQVVAAAADVERGRPFEADDLIAVEIENRFAHSMIAATDASSLLGRVPVADIPEGSPILPAILQSAPTLGIGEEVVSLRIEIGDVPPAIGVGDLVRVVLVPDPSLSVDTAPTETDQPAKVWDILEPTESNADYVVSLVVPKEFLTKAAVSGRSKISLVADSNEAVE